MELIAGEKEMIHVEKLFAMEADRIADNPRKLHETLVIKPVCALQADTINVAGQVIKLVSINPALAVGYNVKQERGHEAIFPANKPFLPRYQIPNPSHIIPCNIHLKLVYHMFQQHHAALLMMHIPPLAPPKNVWQEAIIKHMRVRPMPKVMAEPCQLDQLRGVLEVAPVCVRGAGGVVARVSVQSGDKCTREVRHANGVLEAVVRGAGEHEIRPAELLQFAEALQVRRVEHVDDGAGQLDVAMDGVIDDWGGLAFVWGRGRARAYLSRGLLD